MVDARFKKYTTMRSHDVLSVPLESPTGLDVGAGSFRGCSGLPSSGTQDLGEKK